MSLLINTITTSTGEVFENAFGVVETTGTQANLALWINPEMSEPIRWSPFPGYTITPGQEDQETVIKLAGIGVTATIV